MYRTDGSYFPTHRPLPVSQAKPAARTADSVAQPFRFSRLLVIAGILLAGTTAAMLVS